MKFLLTSELEKIADDLEIYKERRENVQNVNIYLRHKLVGKRAFIDSMLKWLSKYEGQHTKSIDETIRMVHHEIEAFNNELIIGLLKK